MTLSRKDVLQVYTLGHIKWVEMGEDRNNTTLIKIKLKESLVVDD